MTEKKKKTGISKRNKWIIVISVIALIIITALVLAYFYFYYYLKPNFEENDNNIIVVSTAEAVKPGDQIEYAINFKNTGNITVFNVLLKTSIPENTGFINANGNFKFDESSGDIRFDFGELQKDSSASATYTVQVKSPLDDKTVIKASDAILEYIARDEDQTFNIAAPLENIVTSSPIFTEFTASFEDINKGTLNMGDDISFKITLENTGDMNAKNVKIINEMPGKFELYEDSVNPAAIINKNSNEIVWNLEELDVNKLQMFTFKMKTSNDFEHLETFKDIVRLEYGEKIENEIILEDKVYGFPDFSGSINSVIDVDGGSVWAGDVLRYTVTIKNSGLRPGENFKLICPIPGSTSFIVGSADPSENTYFDSENNELIWEIESLDVGEEKALHFNAGTNSSMIKGGTITSAFYIEGDQQFVEIEPVSINVRSYIFQNVVCMGDSQIVRTNWPGGLDYLLESSYPRAEFNTVGSGVPQEMTYQGVRRFDSTIAVYNPQIIVIGYGTNDIGSGTALFRTAMTELINKAKSLGATVIVHSIGYIDMNKNPIKTALPSYNSTLRDICAKNGVPFVDIYGPMSGDPGRYIGPDGLHWTSEGANLVANLVFGTLRNYLDGEGNRK